MTKKWMAISLLMFIVACLLGWWLHNSISKFNADNDLYNLQPSRDMMQKMAGGPSMPQPPEAKNYIPEEFAVIPENNVFSESRSRAEEAAEDTVQMDARPLLRKPVLVGINITDNQKTALLVDVRNSSQGRGGRAEIKRIGDVCQGYTITDIAPDHIVLESGSQKEIIPLHEGSKQNSGGRTPILSTRVVSFSGGGTSGGRQIVSVAKSVPADRTTAAPERTVEAASQPKTVPAVAAVVAPVTQSKPKPAANAQQTSPGTESSAPKTRVVRTPFGDLVRPVRD